MSFSVRCNSQSRELGSVNCYPRYPQIRCYVLGQVCPSFPHLSAFYTPPTPFFFFSSYLSLPYFSIFFSYLLLKQCLGSFLITLFLCHFLSVANWSLHADAQGTCSVSVHFASGVNFPYVFLSLLPFPFGTSGSPVLWEYSLHPNYKGDHSARPTTTGSKCLQDLLLAWLALLIS